MSFSSKRSALSFSKLLTSRLYKISSNFAFIKFELILIRYCSPGVSGASFIQTIFALNFRVTRGKFAGFAIISPRLTSTSRSRQSVIAWGAKAWGAVLNASSLPLTPRSRLSVVIMDFTRAFLFDGSTTTSSFSRISPPVIVPQ